jgi:hypothetical protein
MPGLQENLPCAVRRPQLSDELLGVAAWLRGRCSTAVEPDAKARLGKAGTEETPGEATQSRRSAQLARPPCWRLDLAITAAACRAELSADLISLRNT